MNRLTKYVCACIPLSLAALSSAAITPVYQSANADGSDYRWSYTASIGSGVRVQTGDFFTIYDFGGLDGGAESPTGWAYSSADTGPTPLLLAVPDDATIANVTFEYTGASIVGPADLGTFSVDAIGDTPITTAWASFSTRNGGTTDGQYASDQGSVIVPENITSPNLPEPALGLFAMGLVAPFLRRQR